jgi:hypothetical protein
MKPSDFNSFENLFDECKRRYPVGSYFRCAITPSDISLVVEDTYKIKCKSYDSDDVGYDIRSDSSFGTPDICNIGTARVDFGVYCFTNDDDEALCYMVRNNTWADRCDSEGNILSSDSIEKYESMSDESVYKIGMEVRICHATDDPTRHGYCSIYGGTPSYEQISGVSHKVGIITEIIKLDKGTYLQLSCLSNPSYVHMDRVSIVTDIVSSSNKFNVGDIVKVCKRDEDTSSNGYSNGVGSFSKINGVAGDTAKIEKFIETKNGIYYYLPSSGFIKESCLTLVKSYIQSSIKTSQHDKVKESCSSSDSGSAKVRRPNQQITVSTPIRGVSLKGSGSKIKLGGNNRYH